MIEVETAKMSDRGQIIIPKDIREYIGATENTLFAFTTIDANTIIMRRIDKEKLLREFRSMRERSTKVSEEIIQEEIKEYRLQKRK